MLAQEKVTKEKGSPRQDVTWRSEIPGIFRRDILSRRKTAGVLPAALRVCLAMLWPGVSKRKRQDPNVSLAAGAGRREGTAFPAAQ